jgi:hypothetical protein
VLICMAPTSSNSHARNSTHSPVGGRRRKIDTAVSSAVSLIDMRWRPSAYAHENGPHVKMIATPDEEGRAT